MDLYAGKWRWLAGVGNSAGVANRDHAPLSAGSSSVDATVPPGFGVAARMRSSSHVSNFTPSSRGLRHITRQRRRAVPFAASNNRKLSGITSRVGDIDPRSYVRNIGQGAVTTLAAIEHKPCVVTHAMASCLSLVSAHLASPSPHSDGAALASQSIKILTKARMTVASCHYEFIKRYLTWVFAR